MLRPTLLIEIWKALCVTHFLKGVCFFFFVEPEMQRKDFLFSLI